MIKVTVSPIRSERDYDDALRAVSDLMEERPRHGSKEEALLDVLLPLVEAYESQHFPMPEEDDPIGALEFFMEQRGLDANALVGVLGSRGRVWEVLNRQRPLTLAMIQRLRRDLGVPADLLLGPVGHAA